MNFLCSYTESLFLSPFYTLHFRMSGSLSGGVSKGMLLIWSMKFFFRRSSKQIQRHTQAPTQAEGEREREREIQSRLYTYIWPVSSASGLQLVEERFGSTIRKIQDRRISERNIFLMGTVFHPSSILLCIKTSLLLPTYSWLVKLLSFSPLQKTYLVK